jgi:flagellar motor switch/type III secretory pathway protein FliN
MSEPSHPFTNTADRHDALVDDAVVEVTVSFEPIRMRISEFEAMRGGYVLSLRTRLDAAQLSVWAHGERLAMARLVVVGDNAGVLLETEQ